MNIIRTMVMRWLIILLNLTIVLMVATFKKNTIFYFYQFAKYYPATLCQQLVGRSYDFGDR
jgi:hypothetical protein